MELRTELITSKNFEQMMWELFEEDNDFNGTNGVLYTSDEATERGFGSDLSFAIEVSKSLGLYDKIEFVAKHFEKLNKNSYEILEYNLYPISTGIAFSIVYKMVD